MATEPSTEAMRIAGEAINKPTPMSHLQRDVAIAIDEHVKRKDAEIAALSFQVQRLVDMLNEADAANSAKSAKEIQMQGIAQLCQSNPIRCRNYCDDEGNPAGGYAHGPGMCISWQDGPRGVTQDGNLGPANGAFVEDALMAAHQRLDAFQRSKYAHPANAEAMRLIYEAMQALNMRAMERADRGVLGKNEV